MEESPIAVVRRSDPLAIFTFWLSFLIMIFPTEADILTGFFYAHELAKAALFALLCFSVVFTLYEITRKRYARNPEKLKRSHITGTGVILILNLIMLSMMFAGALSH